ncbi:hypothetical protein DFH08DRAFT_802884 [Mycena albidolilacea]|uniref:Uncharacterized protein n=1 Tax=Mycena albidolilacea TaxID=1033008 RepID=A0AAD7AFA8_9AGAR|nr:hypothetical protein DFH08DRAFT_802884 [Mycena albidolilacea]
MARGQTSYTKHFEVCYSSLEARQSAPEVFLVLKSFWYPPSSSLTSSPMHLKPWPQTPFPPSSPVPLKPRPQPSFFTHVFPLKSCPTQILCLSLQVYLLQASVKLPSTLYGSSVFGRLIMLSGSIDILYYFDQMFIMFRFLSTEYSTPCAGGVCMVIVFMATSPRLAYSSGLRGKASVDMWFGFQGLPTYKRHADKGFDEVADVSAGIPGKVKPGGLGPDGREIPPEICTMQWSGRQVLNSRELLQALYKWIAFKARPGCKIDWQVCPPWYKTFWNEGILDLENEISGKATAQTEV